MKPTISILAILATVSGLAQADASWASLTIDVSGYEFRDELGSPNNEILDVYIWSEAWINCIEWNLTLTTLPPPGATIQSWGSEANIDFNQTLNLQVSNTDEGVVNELNKGSAFVDYTLDRDGKLNLEFWDSYDDAEGYADAVLEEGSYITVYGAWPPSPGPLAAMGICGIFAARRRR